MVIINFQKSQLANRIWNFASFIANSIEHDYKLVNLGFKYAEYFEATSRNDFDGYPITLKRFPFRFADKIYPAVFKNWSSITYKLFKKTPTIRKFYKTTKNEDITQEIFDLNRPDFVKDAKNKPVLVEGWMFRDPINVRKHREKLLKFFKPIAEYQSEINKATNSLANKADVIIGIHIRRGDYAKFAGGRWFYTDEQYAKWMHKLQHLYAERGKSCCFFIASNENIDQNLFEGLNTTFERRHFIVDLYTLANCDIIAGPPSSFSQWAAFYGKKPLVMLTHANQEIEIPELNESLLPDFDFAERNLYTF